jgi:hypothetical protein
VDPIQIAKLALEQLLTSPEVTRIDSDPRRVQVLVGEPAELLSGMAITQRKSFDMVVLDFPRASKRQKVPLLKLTSGGAVEWGPVAHDDPDYRYRLQATTLFYSRLSLNLLSEEGLLLAVATPSTYLSVRSSIEHFLGPDKFLGELVYQTRSGGGNDAKWMSVEHETLLVYARRPEAVARFGLEKSESELEKYREEDAEGRYCWDTYIRKAARNYYRIKCPDGTTLEMDDGGRPISWLWREETFLERLARGDVEFRQFTEHPRWRLYYKDRLKNHKILRSLILNRTPLSDVSENAEPGSSGAGLLTQDGSAELEGYTGADRPQFLKSSRYFRFILQVFGRYSRVLIPFAEYGAAVTAALDPAAERTRLVVIANSGMLPLLKWRAKGFAKSDQKELALRDRFPRVNITSPDVPKAEISAFLELFARTADPQNVEWCDRHQQGVVASLGVGGYINLIVHELPPSVNRTMPIELLQEGFDQAAGSAKRVRVWSRFSRAVIRQHLLLPDDAQYLQFPAFAFK